MIEEILGKMQFNDMGLIPAIVQESESREVLMLAWMNKESIIKTVETNEIHYWSRSRNKLWRKGETSGHFQKLVEFRFDCDNDAILLLVKQIGPACHTNRKNCFYNLLKDGKVTVIHEPIK